jgi:hypothetical protein
MWKVLCKTFAVKFVELDEKEEFDLVQFMRDKGEIWDQIVEEYGLHKTKLEKIACFEALVPVFRFEFQLVSSMNKSKNYEFFEYAETFNSVKFWVMKLREMNLIPIYEH